MAAREDAYRFVHEFSARMARGDLNEVALTALAHNPLLLHLAEVMGERVLDRESLTRMFIKAHDEQCPIDKVRAFDLGIVRVITPKMLSWLTCQVIRFNDRERGIYRRNYTDDREQREHMGETGVVMPVVEITARQVQKLLALDFVHCDFKIDWSKFPSRPGYQKPGVWKVMDLGKNLYVTDGVNRRRVHRHHTDGRHMWSHGKLHDLVLYAVMMERHPHFDPPEGVVIIPVEKGVRDACGGEMTMFLKLEWMQGVPHIGWIGEGQPFDNLLETWVDWRKLK